MRFFIFMIVLAAVLGGSTVFYLDALREKAADVLPIGPSRLELLQIEAEKGEPKALTDLAHRYRTGNGVARDLDAARIFFTKAAQKGYPPAQLALGRLYQKGEGVRQDDTKAARWFSLAAGAGNMAEAQYALGVLYFTGRGVPHDYGRAQDLYLRAANQNHPIAQYLIGNQYEHGWGVRKSLIEAVKWYTLSLSDADRVRAANSQYRPKEAIDRIRGKMNNFQKQRADEAIAKWRAKYGR